MVRSFSQFFDRFDVFGCSVLFPVRQQPSPEECALWSRLGVKLANEQFAREFGAQPAVFDVVLFCAEVDSAVAMEQVALLVSAAAAPRGSFTFIVRADFAQFAAGSK